MNYNVPNNVTDRCYNDVSENCEEYGRLYNWETAMDGAASSTAVPSGVQGVCPDGWHLPSYEEWAVLMQFVNPNCSALNSCVNAGTKLKATSGWNDYKGVSGNGTDEYGFSALPGGVHSSENSNFVNAGNYGGWWSSSGNLSTTAYPWIMNYEDGYASAVSRSKRNLYSVRCLRDYTPSGSSSSGGGSSSSSNASVSSSSNASVSSSSSTGGSSSSTGGSSSSTGGSSSSTGGTDNTRCKDTQGRELFCQWTSGCHAIDPTYATPAGQTCSVLVAECEQWGSLFANSSVEGDDETCQ